jgi:TRAP-type mannitol/chloroaromatic compound transport system permease small subunit
MHNLCTALESFNERIGRALAWLTVPMVIGTFLIAILRYAFDIGWIWMQESVLWMHAALFMLAAAYTLKHDEHVRVDIFYRELSVRGKAWVNLLGTLLLLLPMSIFLIGMSYDYVETSWAIREGSREAGGLPFPFVPLLKSVIPASFVLVVIQGMASLLTSAMVLLDGSSTANSDH